MFDEKKIGLLVCPTCGTDTDELGKCEFCDKAVCPACNARIPYTYIKDKNICRDCFKKAMNGSLFYPAT